MVDIPRSSFIPKETSAAIPTRIKRRRTFHVFNFLASALLVVAILLAGGTYFYKYTLDNKLVSVKEQLREQTNLFSEERLAEVRAFDRQLRAAQYLLDKHLAPSKIFTALEKDTVDRIRFTSFLYEFNYPFDVLMDIQGATEEFKTVALQSNEFRRDTLFEKGIFTDLGTSDVSTPDDEPSTNDNDGKVNFTVKGPVLLEMLSYDGLNATPVNDPFIGNQAEVTEDSEEVSENIVN